MQESLLREIASEHLVPLFSGAELAACAEAASSSASSVAFVSPTEIAFRVNRADPYRLILRRAQPWSSLTTKPLPEIFVVRAFVDSIASMEKELRTSLRHDLLSTFQRRIVARSVGTNLREATFLAGIDLLNRWSARLYEGAPIASAIGFRNRPQEGQTIGLKEIGASEFGAVLSNGHDTLLEFDFQGRFIGHDALFADHGVPPFCPIRQAPVAAWTTRDERRVAMTLNRLGEILVLREKELLFARRGGKWHFMTHKPVITQMGTPQDEALRVALYETCLDASFARTGACFAVVSASHAQEWNALVADADRLEGSKSLKAASISRIVSGRSFKALDRRLRQELAAIDGATVLRHTGEILAVGAIVKVGAGSAGGGRSAAARALSRLGLGIKVSQDGGITGYRLGNSAPAFLIM